MNVRLSVRTDVNNPLTQIGSTDLLEHVVTPGTGLVNPSPTPQSPATSVPAPQA